MMSWNRAGRDIVRVFFTQNQHIAVVTGKKPRRCTEIEIVATTQNPRVPVLLVQCRCQDITQHSDNYRQDNYCVVKPVIAGPLRPYVSVLHRDGSDLVKVEALACVAPANLRPPVRSLEEAVSSFEPASIASSIGFSQDFSLDEAFRDAVNKLRLLPQADLSAQPSMLDVVSMGAVYGGFSGFSRLFVKIEQSSVLSEHSSSTKKLPAKSQAVERERQRSGRQSKKA